MLLLKGNQSLPDIATQQIRIGVSPLAASSSSSSSSSSQEQEEIIVVAGKFAVPCVCSSAFSYNKEREEETDRASTSTNQIESNQLARTSNQGSPGSWAD